LEINQGYVGGCNAM